MNAECELEMKARESNTVSDALGVRNGIVLLQGLQEVRERVECRTV